MTAELRDLSVSIEATRHDAVMTAELNNISISSKKDTNIQSETNIVKLTSNNCVNLTTDKKSVNSNAQGQITQTAEKDINIASKTGHVNIRSFADEINSKSYGDTNITSVDGNVNISGKGNVTIQSTGSISINPGPGQNVSVDGSLTATRVVQGPPGSTTDLLLVPTGAVIPYAGSSAPSGWLMCDGSSYNTIEYQLLYKAIGYTYGGSGGQFTVPDMRGRIPVCTSSSAINGLTYSKSLGNTGGEEYHALSVDEMPQHTHDMPLHGGNRVVDGGVTGSTSTEHGYSSMSTLGSGSSEPHNNMQPYITLNYIIKY